jgi:hypothetical protein
MQLLRTPHRGYCGRGKVGERARDRECERNKGGERERERVCVCVCVCGWVCVRKRETDRQSAGLREICYSIPAIHSGCTMDFEVEEERRQMWEAATSLLATLWMWQMSLRLPSTPLHCFKHPSGSSHSQDDDLSLLDLCVCCPP